MTREVAVFSNRSRGPRHGHQRQQLQLLDAGAAWRRLQPIEVTKEEAVDQWKAEVEGPASANIGGAAGFPRTPPPARSKSSGV